jgi:uncharacterized membrane protein YbhN (UPF0104 family)
MHSPVQYVRSSAFRRIGSAAVTLILLGLLIKVANFSHLIAIIASASLVPIIIATALRAFDRFVMIAKWVPLLRVQVPNVPFTRAARAYLASGLAHYLIPVSVGADLVRATTLGRNERDIPGVTASIVAERLLGMAATGILSLLALFIAVRADVDLTFLFPWALLAIAVGLLALLAPLIGPFAAPVIAWLGRLRHLPAAGFLQKLGIAYRAYRHHGYLLFRIGLLSLLEQLLPVIIAGLVALSLGIVVSLPMFLVAMPLVLFAARLPISVAGIGVAEGATVYLLGLFGVPVEQALALSLVTRAIDIFVVTVPGAYLWQDLVRVRRGGRAVDPAVAAAREHAAGREHVAGREDAAAREHAGGVGSSPKGVALSTRSWIA